MISYDSLSPNFFHEGVEKIGYVLLCVNLACLIATFICSNLLSSSYEKEMGTDIGFDKWKREPCIVSHNNHYSQSQHLHCTCFFFLFMQNLPMQTNGSDCGVHLCRVYIIYIACNCSV